QRQRYRVQRPGVRPQFAFRKHACIAARLATLSDLLERTELEIGEAVAAILVLHRGPDPAVEILEVAGLDTLRAQLAEHDGLVEVLVVAALRDDRVRECRGGKAGYGDQDGEGGK